MPKLIEEQLEALRVTHKKIAIVDWNGHELVLRRPTRDECHAYRVALEHPETKADANEQICQRILVAFDTNTDANAARVTFTGSFLVEHPMFSSSGKIKVALAALMGLVEEDDLADLGKGVSVRPLLPRPTLQA